MLFRSSKENTKSAITSLECRRSNTNEVSKKPNKYIPMNIFQNYIMPKINVNKKLESYSSLSTWLKFEYNKNNDGPITYNLNRSVISSSSHNRNTVLDSHYSFLEQSSENTNLHTTGKSVDNKVYVAPKIMEFNKDKVYEPFRIFTMIGKKRIDHIQYKQNLRIPRPPL